MLEVCIVVKRSLFSCRLSPRQIPGGHYRRQKTTPFSRGSRHPTPTACASARLSRPRGPRCALRVAAAFSSPGFSTALLLNVGLAIRLVATVCTCNPAHWNFLSRFHATNDLHGATSPLRVCHCCCYCAGVPAAVKSKSCHCDYERPCTAWVSGVETRVNFVSR